MLKERGITLSGCYNFIKFSLVVFNFLFWILGWVIFGIGIYGATSGAFRDYIGHQHPHLYTAAGLFIGTGIIILVVSMFGCLGALRESRFFLVLYYLALFIVFVFLMSAALWAVANQTSIRLNFFHFVDEHVKNYKQDPTFMDMLQKDFECCGSHSPFDYQGSIPASCGRDNIEAFRRPGCNTKLQEYARSHISQFAAAGIAIAIITILGMAFAMTMCFALSEVGR